MSAPITEEWIYTGLYATDTGAHARWSAPGPRLLLYPVNPKNKAFYKGLVIGGRYTVSVLRDEATDSTSLYVAGEKAPKYIGRHDNADDIAAWQANRVTYEAGLQTKKLAETAKDDELLKAIGTLRTAARKLPFNQRLAFEAWVLARLR